MPVDVLTEIEIDRPPEVVAAYATDPDNATSWYENIERVEWKTPPPLAVGSRIAFVARFLGRRLEYTYEVRELVPGGRLVMSTADGPFAMETTYTWERTAGGTRMTLRNRGEPAGFSRVAAPLLARAMRRANRKDLDRLKSIIEGQELALGATRWVLVELGGEQVAAAATGDAPYVELEGGRVSGTGGCNRLTGTYETSEDTLHFGALATTRMACDEAVMRRETAFLAALAATMRFELAGSSLVLLDADRALARLEAWSERAESGLETAGLR
jgi:heat shock protein HslJ